MLFCRVSAQIPVPKQVYPVMTFLQMDHDYGKIAEDSIYICHFIFFNSGKAPLLIKEVLTSCACTAPRYPMLPVHPGDSASITVAFNSRGYGGKSFNKHIIIKTNVPDPQRNSMEKKYILKIRGQVIPAEDLIPQNTSVTLSKEEINLGTIKKGAKKKETVFIINHGDSSIAVKNIHNYFPALKIFWKNKTLESGEKMKIKVVFHSSLHHTSEFIDRIRILTDIPPEQSRKISVEGIPVRAKITE
jgi:hypothetical protein